MCDCEYSVYNAIKDGNITENKLFSKHIQEKVNGFKENIKTNVYNIICLCKYDKTRCYADGQNGFGFGEYIMVKQNDEGKVFILGLTKKDNVYIPVTNQYYESLEEAKDKLSSIFNKQSVTIVTGYKINEPRNLSPEVKYKKIASLNSLIKECGVNADIDVSKDYTWVLSKAITTYKNGGGVNPNFADAVSACINSGQLITPDMLGLTSFGSLPNGFKTIVEAINSQLTKNLGSDFLEENTHNTNVVSQLEELKVLCEKLKREIDELKSTKEELESKNKTLEQQNEKLNIDAKENVEIMRKIRDLVTKEQEEKNQVNISKEMHYYPYVFK